MLTKVIAVLGYVVLAINFLLYYKAYSYNKDKVIKTLTYYLAITLMIQLSTKTLNYFAVSNLFLSHIYFISQFICLSFFYHLLLFPQKKLNYLKIVAVVVIILVVCSFAIDTSLFIKFNLFEITMTSLPLIIYSVLLLFKSMSIRSNAFVYINTGILFYLLSSTLIFLSGNLINKLHSFYNDITWLVNAILYLLFQLFIFYEWYQNLRYKKKRPKDYQWKNSF